LFRLANLTTPEVISAHLLNFKQIFDPTWKKIVRETPSLVWGALARLGYSLAGVKIWRHSTS